MQIEALGISVKGKSEVRHALELETRVKGKTRI